MSISLSSTLINKRSPYHVSSDNGYSFVFKTDYGQLYEVGFVEDYTLGDNTQTYQFFITAQSQSHTPLDYKVRETIIVILEEFFKNDFVSLLYICDTSDGKQVIRDRLFAIWFNRYEYKEYYVLIRKVLEVEGISFFVSLVSKRDMPLLSDRIRSLDSIHSSLKQK